MKERFDIEETLKINGSYEITNGATSVRLSSDMTGSIIVERSKSGTGHDDIAYEFKLSNGPVYVKPFDGAIIDPDDNKDEWLMYSPGELAEYITWPIGNETYKRNFEILFNRFLEIYRNREG